MDHQEWKLKIWIKFLTYMDLSRDINNKWFQEELYTFRDHRKSKLKI